MIKDLVSIIIPVYNAEKYLGQCISSCVGQSYENIEIILIDDGSTDSSLQICKEWVEKDQRIKLFRQPNKGVSAARNIGLRNAIGDYISFMDSDDELIDNGIEVMLKAIHKYKADIVTTAHIKVDENGNEHSASCDGDVRIYEDDESIKLSLLYDRCTIAVWAKLFSKEIVSGVFFKEGHNINEDGYFVFQCCVRNPKLVQLNVPVYKYFVREDSATRGGFSEKYFDILYFSDKKMEYIRKNIPSMLELAMDMEVSSHLIFLSVLCRDVEKKYQAEMKESIKLVRRRFLRYSTINNHEKLMAAIVSLGLYPIYKTLVIKKYYNNKTKHCLLSSHKKEDIKSK